MDPPPPYDDAIEDDAECEYDPMLPPPQYQKASRRPIPVEQPTPPVHHIRHIRMQHFAEYSPVRVEQPPTEQSWEVRYCKVMGICTLLLCLVFIIIGVAFGVGFGVKFTKSSQGILEAPHGTPATPPVPADKAPETTSGSDSPYHCKAYYCRGRCGYKHCEDCSTCRNCYDENFCHNFYGSNCKSYYCRGRCGYKYCEDCSTCLNCYDENFCHNSYGSNCKAYYCSECGYSYCEDCRSCLNCYDDNFCHKSYGSNCNSFYCTNCGYQYCENCGSCLNCYDDNFCRQSKK